MVPDHLNAWSGAPIYRQITDHLRAAVCKGLLAPGVRLPSSRTLARELNVSRNTVLRVFEALIDEGILTGKTGAGTFVERRASGKSNGSTKSSASA
jgi:GntR family transcriptional regulator/MocR family aminotransferase